MTSFWPNFIKIGAGVRQQWWNKSGCPTCISMPATKKDGRRRLLIRWRWNSHICLRVNLSCTALYEGRSWGRWWNCLNQNHFLVKKWTFHRYFFRCWAPIPRQAEGGAWGGQGANYCFTIMKPRFEMPCPCSSWPRIGHPHITTHVDKPKWNPTISNSF